VTTTPYVENAAAAGVYATGVRSSEAGDGSDASAAPPPYTVLDRVEMTVAPPSRRTQRLMTVQPSASAEDALSPAAKEMHPIARASSDTGGEFTQSQPGRKATYTAAFEHVFSSNFKVGFRGIEAMVDSVDMMKGNTVEKRKGTYVPPSDRSSRSNSQADTMH